MVIYFLVESLIQTNPIAVLVGAILLLVIVSVYAFVRREPSPKPQNPLEWLRNPLSDESEKMTKQSSGTVMERLYTDNNGETWWKRTNPDGQVEIEHENYDRIFEKTEKRMKML